MRSTQAFRPRPITFAAIAVITAIGCLSHCLPNSASANPTTQDHEKGLKAHGTIDGSQKQIELMYGKFAEWEKLAINSTELMKAGRRFPHQQLSRIFPETYRGIWYAKHLQAMGEPAGYDLERKYTELRKALFVFAPKLSEFHPQAIAKLKKETPKRRQALTKIKALADQGKLAEAERLIEALRLRQLTSVFYLTNPQSQPFRNEVGPPHKAILAKLNERRRQDYREQAQEKIDAYRDAITTLQTESARVTSELRQSPTVTLAEGMTGDAADAIGYVRTLWGNATVAITRSLGVALAFEKGNTQAISASFSKEFDRVKSIANKSLGGILSAAAISTPTEKVSALFPRILIELSLIDRRYVGQLDSSFAPLLEQLAATDQMLAAQTKRYSVAITEPTRWMRRYTFQQVKHQDREYPAAASLLSRKLSPETSVRPTIYGSNARRERNLTPGTFTGPASWLASDAKMLVGMKTAVEASVRISPSIKTAIVPLDGIHYVNVPAALPLDKYVTEINQSLLLDDSHGPLDLGSANAKSSADRQEFRNTGGTITRLTLEPTVSRLATMPDAARVLIPLNSMPIVDSSGSAVEKAIWRIDLQPAWVAHDLFFVKLK